MRALNPGIIRPPDFSADREREREESPHSCSARACALHGYPLYISELLRARAPEIGSKRYNGRELRAARVYTYCRRLGAALHRGNVCIRTCIISTQRKCSASWCTRGEMGMYRAWRKGKKRASGFCGCSKSWRGVFIDGPGMSGMRYEWDFLCEVKYESQWYCQHRLRLLVFFRWTFFLRVNEHAIHMHFL